MDLYPKYKSPLGYEIGDDGIDSYGVDHSGFSTRDELEYQMARQQREQQLMQNYSSQGITQDYPQYGTDFWGDNNDNNYGFGTSDISGNVQNITNMLDFCLLVNLVGITTLTLTYKSPRFSESY